MSGWKNKPTVSHFEVICFGIIDQSLWSSEPAGKWRYEPWTDQYINTHQYQTEERVLPRASGVR